MRTLTVTVPENFNLFLFGDDHMGTKLRHNKGWKTMTDMMNKSYCGIKANRGIDHGDIVDAIASDDIRFNLGTVEGNLFQQIEQAFKARLPILDKLLVVIDGNHPAKLHRYGDITKLIVNRLNEATKKHKVINGTRSCHITYVNPKGELLFRHFACHGNGSINSRADSPERQELTMLLSLKKKLAPMFANTVLNSMGHTHKLLIKTPVREFCLGTTKSGKITSFHNGTVPHTDDYIHPDKRWFVNTGSFYRLFSDDCDTDSAISGYAECAMYPPIETGFAIARVRNGRIQGIDKIEV